MAKPYPKSRIIATTPDFPDYIGNTNYWIMKTGDTIAITALRKTHIVNILDMTENKPFWRQEYKPVLIAELRRRKELSLIKKGKAGKILYGR